MRPPYQASTPPTLLKARRPAHRLAAALAHRDFRLLWLTAIWWQLGYWILTITQGWLVFELTGSPLQLGVVGFASGLPMLVLTPLGGALADRADRRRILLVTQSIQVAIALCQAILAVGQWIEVWHVAALAGASGVFSSISGPTRQSMALDLAGREDLANAIALTAIAQNSIRVVGPAMGGALIGTLGAQGAFFFQAGCFVCAALFTLSIRKRERVAVQRAPFVETVTEGMRYGWQDKVVLAVLTLSAVTTFFGLSYIQLMPAFAKEVLGLGAAGFGLLTAAPGIGALAGSVYAAWTSDGGGKGKQLLASQVGMGVFLVVLAFSRTFPFSFVALVAAGLAGAVWTAMSSTILQTRSSPEFQGRVTALQVLTFGFQTTGSLAAGAIAGPMGIPGVLAAFGGVVVAAGAAVAALHPGLRRA